MKCPKCRLINPDTALRCDCGYDFSSGQMKGSYLKAKSVDHSNQTNQKTSTSASPKKMVYRWLPVRLWLCLFLYWLVAMIGAGVVAQEGAGGREAGWIIFVMLALVSICMASERGQWKVWKKVGLVPLTWLAHSALALPTALTVGVSLAQSGRSYLVDRGIAFVASIPIVIFAMRRSTWFVELDPHLDTLTPPKIGTKSTLSDRRRLPRPKVSRHFLLPEGGTAPRASFQDVPTFHRRIFGRIGNHMRSGDPDRTVIPGVNAYNYGRYEEAWEHFSHAIALAPAVEEDLYPHLTICRRVLDTPKDNEDRHYEEQIRRWKSVVPPFRWVLKRPVNKLRCKYCGHYTPYVDPMAGLAYLGTNNCQKCGRGYPTPDFVWDSLDGQAYTYYRRSVREQAFYQEFEEVFEVEQPVAA